MTNDGSVLVIGLDPTLIDFSQPGYAPGMDAQKVLAGLKACEGELTRLGYSVQMCLTDFGETAEAVVQVHLEQQRYACIVIGAGVRTNPSNFILFEKLINVVHQHAPQAKICFNTIPIDTAAAVQRWLLVLTCVLVARTSATEVHRWPRRSNLVVRSDSQESRPLHEFLGRRRLVAPDSRAMWQRLLLTEVDLTGLRWEITYLDSVFDLDQCHMQ